MAVQGELVGALHQVETPRPAHGHYSHLRVNEVPRVDWATQDMSDAHCTSTNSG